MIDLIYDKAVIPYIRKYFADFRVEDASDFIHTDRVQVECSDENETKYLKAVIKAGAYNISLVLGLMVYENLKEIHRLLGEMKAEDLFERLEEDAVYD